MNVGDEAEQRRSSDIEAAEEADGSSAQNKDCVRKERRSANDGARRAHSSTTRRLRQQHDTEQETELLLKYGAGHVIMLVIPVSICMIFVILTVNTIRFYTILDTPFVYAPFIAKTGRVSELLWMSFGNALIFISLIVFTTFALILLYKYKYYKVLHGWLFLSTLPLLFIVLVVYLRELFKTYQIPADLLSVAFVVWNYAVMGMICIHSVGPLHLQQAYLVVVCAQTALLFIKYLPDWTPYACLFVVSIWDLIAVLCPKGPLRMLVETAHERNEPFLPALVYSSGMVYSYVTSSLAALGTLSKEESSDEQLGEEPEESQPLAALTDGTSTPSERQASLSSSSSHHSDRPGSDLDLREALQCTEASAPAASASRVEVAASSTNSRARGSTGNHAEDQPTRSEGGGVKLGLGDFIFYSLLVGKASSSNDWNTTVACYIGILVGLCFTLLLLAIFKKALPALPISIAFGLVFNFFTCIAITPFCMQLSVRQIVY